jgi:hypothetical protein
VVKPVFARETTRSGNGVLGLDAKLALVTPGSDHRTVHAAVATERSKT